MEFTLAFGPKPEFSFSFKFFFTTHGYILAHIALKINICFPLGKKFARLTHQAKVTRMRRAIFIKNIQNKCLLKEMHMV